MFGLFLVFMLGQFFAGRLDYNEEQRKHGEPEAGYFAYLKTGHFQEATAKNWEGRDAAVGKRRVAHAAGAL